MRLDLICAMNSYLNASTMIDRSVCLHRIYMIETAAMTHLYGYNEKYRQKSIWHAIKRLAEFSSVPESKLLEQRLAEYTDTMDCTRRNLFTHYRENTESNISKRWQEFQKMDHVNEIFRLIGLIYLCNDISSYAQSIFSAISENQKRESAETKQRNIDMLSKIRDIGEKIGDQNIVDRTEKLLNRINELL